MNISFANLINSLTKLEYCGEALYNIDELYSKLDVVDTIAVPENAKYLLVPFYVSEQTVYEIYWCEFTVQMVDSPNFKNYLLDRTGKETIDQIDDVIVERMQNLYIEVVMPESAITASEIKKCLSYIKNSEELIKDVTTAFTRNGQPFSFDEGSIYIAIYDG